MPEESPTKVLTSFSANASFEDLPEQVVHEAKRVMLDSFGVAMASPLTDRGKIAIAYARQLGGPPEATVLGVGDRVSCQGAAFANGEMISDLDYDVRIRIEDWGIHLTPFVVSAPVAVAEREGASGKDLILAVTLAHEVGARILASVSSRSGGESVEPLVYGYSTGALGGTAGVCSILRFDQMKTANALGVACHMIPVPTAAKWRFGVHSPIHKYCIAGWQGTIAIAATALAEMGYYSDTTFLDGERGFWRMYGATNESKWGILTEGLGEKWHIVNADYKFYPHCAITHRHLDAFASIIKENGLRPDEIDKVEVKGGLNGIFNPLRQNREIGTHLDTQFSIYYGFAAVAYDIKPIDWQDPMVFRNPKIIGFMDKVSYQADNNVPCVTVKARGRTFEKNVSKRISAVTDEALMEKFRSITSKTLAATKAEKAIEAIMKLEDIEDLRELMRLLST